MERVERFIGSFEAARFLGLAAQTLARWRCEGSGPPFRRFGRRVLYDVADLTAWAENQPRRRSTSDTEPKPAGALASV